MCTGEEWLYRGASPDPGHRQTSHHIRSAMVALRNVYIDLLRAGVLSTFEPKFESKTP